MDIAIELFNADIETVKQKLLSLSPFNSFQVSSQNHSSGKMEVLGMLTPQYLPSQIRFILFEPICNIGTTICYTNLSNGWGEVFDGRASSLGFKAYHCRICDEQYAAYHFDCFDGTKKRYVLCYQDPQWVFYEEGEPLEFEDVELYKSRLKKNRLNREIILKYLKRLGWDIMNENFWSTENVVYEFVQTTPHI